jgi:muramoyltetrapeptide carboxypeptidase
MLHLALGRLGVESLHATMPGKFRFGRDETPEAIVSDEALRSALLGLRQGRGAKRTKIKVPHR